MSINDERRRLAKNKSKTGYLLKKLHLEEKKAKRLTKSQQHLKCPKDALYVIMVVTLLFALLYGISAGQVNIPKQHLNAVTGDSDASDEVYNADVEAQIRQIAEEYDFQWPDYLVRLARCESNLDPLALGDSGHSRGLFQIHDEYWPMVTDEQAYDVEWSCRWTMDMINDGYQHYFSCDKLI